MLTLAKVRDDSLSGVVGRVLPCEDESLEAVNDALIVKNVRPLKETSQKIVTAHLALSHSTAAVCDDLKDVGIESALVLNDVRC